MHTHKHSTTSARIGWAFFLNLIFTVIEFIGGWLSNSVSIMADAVHDLGDTLSIGSSWILDRAGNKQADSEYTYGYRRLSLLGALINGIVLIAGSTWVLLEAVPRLFDPVLPHVDGMIGLAVLGASVNGIAAYKLSHGSTLNEKVLNWHLLEDVLGWVAVLVVAITMKFVEWPVLDPILSIGFTLFILVNVIRNLRATTSLFFQASPDSKLIQEVREKLLSVDNIDAIHHLHLWSLDGERHVLTTHATVSKSVNEVNYVQLKEALRSALEHFNIEHTTIEIESPEEICRDSS